MNKTHSRYYKEPYWGSVRFFKHLILTVLALLIIIPTSLCIILFLRQNKISKAYEQQSTVVLEQAEQIRRLQEDKEQNAKKQSAAQPESTPLSANVSDKQPSDEWNMVLVNNHFALPPDYQMKLVQVGEEQYVDERIAEPLNQMMDAAEAEGVHLYIYSSYRSIEKQQNLFYTSMTKLLEAGDDYNTAFYKTKQKIALPSESEHHTGLMVDIIGADGTSDEIEAGSEEMKWLTANCARYGFIQRYPEGKTEITGIDFEPYCYRYVGTEAAEYIASHNITLEEYLQMNAG